MTCCSYVNNYTYCKLEYACVPFLLYFYACRFTFLVQGLTKMSSGSGCGGVLVEPKKGTGWPTLYHQPAHHSLGGVSRKCHIVTFEGFEYTTFIYRSFGNYASCNSENVYFFNECYEKKIGVHTGFVLNVSRYTIAQNTVVLTVLVIFLKHRTSGTLQHPTNVKFMSHELVKLRIYVLQIAISRVWQAEKLRKWRSSTTCCLCWILGEKIFFAPRPRTQQL